MASDSLATDDCTKNSVAKIFRVRRHLVGVAGCYAHCMAFINWLKAGADEDEIPCFDDVYALALCPEGIWVYDGHPQPYQLKDKFAAVGSGSQAALAAMHCGLSPRDSVRIAAKIDPATGGRIITKRLLT
jgi:ATP-dependent protease HslVU (ClpYQ) peptidase subunit